METYNRELGYSIDIVFVIDASSSMKPLLDTVKNTVLGFWHDLKDEMEARAKPVTKIRARVITFRDYSHDKEDAMMVTDFFELPGQFNEFFQCISRIQARGGSGGPEDGLEALAYAMKSNWNTEAGITRHRHVIVLWTDDGTHPLGFGKHVHNYPNGMAKDFDELSKWWGSRGNQGIMDEASKRLLLFAPDKESYTSIYNSWNNVVFYESEAGKDLEEDDYQTILGSIPFSP